MSEAKSIEPRAPDIPKSIGVYETGTGGRRGAELRQPRPMRAEEKCGARQKTSRLRQVSQPVNRRTTGWRADAARRLRPWRRGDCPRPRPAPRRAAPCRPVLSCATETRRTAQHIHTSAVGVMSPGRREPSTHTAVKPDGVTPLPLVVYKIRHPLRNTGDVLVGAVGGRPVFPGRVPRPRRRGSSLTPLGGCQSIKARL